MHRRFTFCVGVLFPQQEMRTVPRNETQPTRDMLDGVVPTEAQERSVGGGQQEADTTYPQAPAGDHRHHLGRDHDSAQPEA